MRAEIAVFSSVVPVKPSGSEKIELKSRSRSDACLNCAYGYHNRRDCLAGVHE